MFQGPERRRPVRESGDVSDSGGAGTAHYPESLGRPGWLRALHYWCLAQGSLVHQEEVVPLHCH